MASIKNKMERFLGINIRLHYKSGEIKILGDGFLISDGIKVHIWTGTVTADGKNFLIPTDRVKEEDVEKLEKATYRDTMSKSFKILVF